MPQLLMPTGSRCLSSIPEKSFLLERLSATGWYIDRSARSGSLAGRVNAFAHTLGKILPGRGRQPIERVVPLAKDSAVPGSLSSRYGLESLPLHTDTAHWPRPCRYLVIACEDPGPVSTPTALLDSARVKMSEDDDLRCKTEVFLVQNGRQSFYGSILEAGRPFVRLDQGCMRALTRAGNAALRTFDAMPNRMPTYLHSWEAGDILVLDNWRVLHGRGNGGQTSEGRVLLRALVE